MATYLEKRLLTGDFGLRGDLVVVSRVRRRGHYLVSIAAYDRKKKFHLLMRVMSSAQIEATSVPFPGLRGMFWRSHKTAMKLRAEALAAA